MFRERPLHWLERYAGWIAVAAALVGAVRIAATYAHLSHTSDEPPHIAAGMEWLDRGIYQMEPQHPPLARIFAALGPYLAGARSHGNPSMPVEGALILYDGGHYFRNLALARAGILPFFWLACAVVWLAGRRWYGRAQAALAVALFTLLPPVLAHAGLATTDMALTATFGLAIYAVIRCWEQPSPAAGAAMGLALALTVAAKFSSLVFIPTCLAAFLAAAWFVGARISPPQRAHAVALACALPAGFLLLWAVFRFSAAGGLPAPELYAGLRQVREHNETGHWAYLMGRISLTGFPLYYPVALTLKTPLGFLLLLLGGVAGAWRRKQLRWLLPVAGSLALLAVGLGSRINIGVRHLLPIYGFFALLAAAFAWEGLRSGAWWRHGITACIAWMALSGGWQHPDYLAYFNELAGSQPERFLADSDLDWGQDIDRLGRRLRELKAPSVAFSPYTVGNLEVGHDFPPVTPNSPVSPSPGWNAISITYWKAWRMGWFNTNPGRPTWPNRFRPRERVGRGILLYYFPPEQFRPVRGGPER